MCEQNSSNTCVDYCYKDRLEQCMYRLLSYKDTLEWCICQLLLQSVCVCVCMCVCMYVCVYVCLFVDCCYKDTLEWCMCAWCKNKQTFGVKYYTRMLNDKLGYGKT